MMRLQFLTALLLCSLMVNAGEVTPVGPTVAVKPVESVMNVSLISLIAKPEKYTGKRVRLVGVLSLDFEDTALYFDKEAYKFYRMQEAVFLHLDQAQVEETKELAGQYVIVEGVFKLLEEGGAFAGDLGHVTRIEARAQRE